MAIFTKHETHLVVLRDAERCAAALREALESADDVRRPGLQQAIDLVTQAGDIADARIRGDWVRQRLAAAGVGGPSDSVQAVRALRQAEPGLSLRHAVELTREAAASDPRDGRQDPEG